ncbi:GTPase-activating protein GYP1 [Iris pallida]|uniref:GTPase-activating protein GYP1 n=1 Tax=Iris pallida TaxID=29817 RepID=A0AAX6I860_IRIPA|nr:GTPase-activating protein GYP1 [Iris pallida]
MRSGTEEEGRGREMSTGSHGSSNSNSSSSSSIGNSSSSPNLEWRFNQTLRNVQGLLKGRTFPGKVLLTRKAEPLNECASPRNPQDIEKRYSDSDLARGEWTGNSLEREVQNSGNTINNVNPQKLRASTKDTESTSPDSQKSVSGARATDTARLTKFTKELSRPAVILEKLRELAWSGIPPYMRPNVWRLLLGYAPPNSDRREGVLARKRLEYLDCVSQYYDIPDSERSDDEISMLRQIAVDCPRTVPDVTFFQQAQVQKSLERVLYTWAIRHPASGYVQGINDLLTPFLLVFLSEHLDGSMQHWSISDLSPQKISSVEADCYWCLSKLLDGMQDHYTFAQPGIQRLVFKLKELVRRIDEPVSRHMEDQGLEFLQFAFRWFNCLLIREIPFHLVTRLWDTYLAEGDALPEFLVYISASFLLTWSDKLQKLEFQEMVMFLQHLPTQNWTYHELEMVLSRAYMWHTMFNSSPSHLAS